MTDEIMDVLEGRGGEGLERQGWGSMDGRGRDPTKVGSIFFIHVIFFLLKIGNTMSENTNVDLGAYMMYNCTAGYSSLTAKVALNLYSLPAIIGHVIPEFLHASGSAAGKGTSTSPIFP